MGLPIYELENCVVNTILFAKFFFRYIIERVLTEVFAEGMWNVHSVYIGGPSVWRVVLCRASGVVTSNKISDYIEVGVF